MDEKTVEAMNYAGAMVASELYQVYGFAQSTLAFSGNFSGTNWTATLSGMYGGQSVGISFIGTSGAAGGSFTDNGFVGGLGGDMWSGSGSWTYTADLIDPSTLYLTWNSQDTVVGPISGSHQPDREITVPVTWHPNPDGSRSDEGEYYRTEGGNVVGGPHKIHSHDEDEDIPGRSSRSYRVSMPDDFVELRTSVDFGAGTLGGNVATGVPLPPVASAGAGCLGLLGAWRGLARGRRAVAG